MEKVMLSQHEALMIEVLRAKGLSDGELLQALKNEEHERIQALGGDDFDFAELLSDAKDHWDVLERAVKQGYEIKFNTISGIRYLLRTKFNKYPDADYSNEGNHLSGLKLSEEERIALRSVLSRYWLIAEQSAESEDGCAAYNIVLNIER